MRPPEPYRRVLLPTDLEGEGAPLAYAHAFRLALEQAGDLHVVHVHHPDRGVTWEPLPSARELLARWGRIDPDAGVEDFVRLGVRVTFTALPSLELDDPIVDLLDRERPDLLVVRTHARKGLERLRVPSVAEDLARHAPCPTLFVPDDARPFVDPATGAVSLRHVLVPISSVSASKPALAEALRLVDTLRAPHVTFHLVHIGYEGTVPPLELPDDPRFEFRMDVRHGPVTDEIISAILTHDADVCVMSTRGHDSLADMLRGSRTEMVVRRARCPVLAVPLRRR